MEVAENKENETDGECERERVRERERFGETHDNYCTVLADLAAFTSGGGQPISCTHAHAYRNASR